MTCASGSRSRPSRTRSGFQPVSSTNRLIGTSVSAARLSANETSWTARPADLVARPALSANGRAVAARPRPRGGARRRRAVSRPRGPRALSWGCCCEVHPATFSQLTAVVSVLARSTVGATSAASHRAPQRQHPTACRAIDGWHERLLRATCRSSMAGALISESGLPGGGRSSIEGRRFGAKETQSQVVVRPFSSGGPRVVVSREAMRCLIRGGLSLSA
jgi:hypothetical protein